MTGIKLGQPVDLSAFKVGDRDSVHVPCVLVTCDDYIDGSEYIRFLDSSLTKVKICSFFEANGRVDPFLKKVVHPGVPFWVMIDPNLVTPTTHHFEVTIPGLSKPKVDPTLEEIQRLKEKIQHLQDEKKHLEERNADLEYQADNSGDGVWGCSC